MPKNSKKAVLTELRALFDCLSTIVQGKRSKWPFPETIIDKKGLKWASVPVGKW